jgi:hypothetical protein
MDLQRTWYAHFVCIVVIGLIGCEPTPVADQPKPGAARTNVDVGGHSTEATTPDERPDRAETGVDVRVGGVHGVDVNVGTPPATANSGTK